jgi:hypothetical protein
MHWFKRDLWKAGIALAGMLLLLVLMMWIPVSAAGAYEGAPGLATPGTGTVQTTPTVDPTMIALQKEQLTQQVRQLDNWWLYWLYNGSTAFIAGFSAIAVASLGLYQWRGNRNAERQKEIAAQDKDLKDRQAEREKQAEERFQKVVEGLGSERTEAKVGAAITLRTFLQPGYEQRFYRQAFDLAVAHLGLRKAQASASNPLNSPASALIIPKGNLQQEQQALKCFFDGRIQRAV